MYEVHCSLSFTAFQYSAQPQAERRTLAAPFMATEMQAWRGDRENHGQERGETTLCCHQKNLSPPFQLNGLSSRIKTSLQTLMDII